jgi:hypothetical protein
MGSRNSPGSRMAILLTPEAEEANTEIVPRTFPLSAAFDLVGRSDAFVCDKSPLAMM